MLEDHSPTSRSSSRKPFRRKGAKTVIFNNSCTYFQLDPISYASSDEGEEEDDPEDLITESQIEDYDEPATGAARPYGDTDHALQKGQQEITELEDYNEHDISHPSPRIGIETVDVSG